MANIVRSSKYRHIFGSPAKDTYNGIKITRDSSDSKLCAVNPKFVAIIVEGSGGGPFLVLPVEKFGRVSTTPSVVSGHTQKVLDLAWSPFLDNVIASCSEDCSIMVWEIPDGGLTENLQEPWVKLEGHDKKVTMLEWHPCADGILASGSADNRILIWNVHEASTLFTIQHPDAPQCMSWNFDGSLIATTCKDKYLRVADVRAETFIQECKKGFFEGSKPAKCVFLKDGRIFAAGFGRMSRRMIGLWDSKDLSNALMTDEVDQASGIVYLHYDVDNNVVFTVAKGDSQVKYYEITKEEPYVHFLSLCSRPKSHRGFAWMPKRGLDVTTHEIARCYRLFDDKCEVLSMVVPRKSDLFQEDIYPPCFSDEPALTADEWCGGKTANPKTMSMKALFDEQKGSKGSQVKKSNKPVRSLSQRAPKTSLSVAPAEQNGVALPPGINFEELADDVKKLKATVRKVCRRLNTLEKQLGEVVADDGQEEEE